MSRNSPCGPTVSSTQRNSGLRKSRSISSIARSITSVVIGSSTALRSSWAVTIRIIGMARPFMARVAGFTLGGSRPGVVWYRRIRRNRSSACCLARSSPAAIPYAARAITANASENR